MRENISKVEEEMGKKPQNCQPISFHAGHGVVGKGFGKMIDVYRDVTPVPGRTV